MGTINSEGVYVYSEDDPASPFSDLLNLGQSAQTAVVAALRAQLTQRAALPTRYMLIGKTGILGTGAGAFDLVDPQTIPARPFGAVDWRVNCDAWLTVSLPSGLGASLEVHWNGVVIARDRFTNPGSSAHTHTFKIARATAWVAAATATPNTLRATLTALGGSISIPADAGGLQGAVSIDATMRRGF